MRSAVHTQAKRTAERSALRLMAFADAVWPDAPINALVADEIMDESVVFAAHARRVLDASRATNEIQLSQATLEYFKDSSGLEKDLRKALNAIIHAIDLRVWVSPTQESRFKDCGNVQMQGLLATTDKFPARLIDIRGMAWAYLTLPSEKTHE